MAADDPEGCKAENIYSLALYRESLLTLPAHVSSAALWERRFLGGDLFWIDELLAGTGLWNVCGGRAPPARGQLSICCRTHRSVCSQTLTVSVPSASSPCPQHRALPFHHETGPASGAQRMCLLQRQEETQREET